MIADVCHDVSIISIQLYYYKVIVWFLVKVFEKYALVSFTKTTKLHSSYGLAFGRFLKNVFLHVFSQVVLEFILLPIRMK